MISFRNFFCSLSGPVDLNSGIFMPAELADGYLVPSFVGLPSFMTPMNTVPELVTSVSRPSACPSLKLPVMMSPEAEKSCPCPDRLPPEKFPWYLLPSGRYWIPGPSATHSTKCPEMSPSSYEYKVPSPTGYSPVYFHVPAVTVVSFCAYIVNAGRSAAKTPAATIRFILVFIVIRCQI